MITREQQLAHIAELERHIKEFQFLLSTETTKLEKLRSCGLDSEELTPFVILLLQSLLAARRHRTILLTFLDEPLGDFSELPSAGPLLALVEVLPGHQLSPGV